MTIRNIVGNGYAGAGVPDSGLAEMLHNSTSKFLPEKTQKISPDDLKKFGYALIDVAGNALIYRKDNHIVMAAHAPSSQENPGAKINNKDYLDVVASYYVKNREPVAREPKFRQPKYALEFEYAI